MTGTGGRRLIEMANMSVTPMAIRSWKMSGMGSVTVAAFFKYVRSNSDAGRPDSSTLMFLKLVANFKISRWAELK